MYTSLGVLLFFPVLVFCQTEDVGDTVKIDLSSVSIPAALPNSFALKHCPYSGSGYLTSRNGVPRYVLDREAGYTWIWLTRALRTKFLPRLRTSSAEIDSKIRRDVRYPLEAFSHIQGKDDGVGARYFTDKYKIEILDARMLTILVRSRKKRPMSPLALFREIMNFDQGIRQNQVKVEIAEQTKLQNGTAFGRIRVTRVHSAGWFARPIEWFSATGAVLFLFQKEIVLGDSILPPSDPTVIVGGMPYADGRPFLRFQKTNRTTIARDYFGRMWKKRQPIPRTETGSDTGYNADGTLKGGI